MITIQLLILILVTHWVGDFVLQTDDQAKNKSTDLGYLLEHTASYSLLWILSSFFMFEDADYITKWLKMGLFVGITFLIHTLTDYFTSKLNKKLWDNKQVHYFFVSIGFDQILHYLQLTLTYLLLK